MRKKKQLPLLREVEITGIAAEGKAVARVDDLVVFVPYVVPGDVVDLQLTRRKNSYAEAVATRLVRPSTRRSEPFCPHFGVCGGCKWQVLPYEEQLKWKQKQVEDALSRIGHLTLPPTTPILGSELTRRYRNKLEFTFADRRWLTTEEVQTGLALDHDPALGFHMPGCFDKVLQIEECHLMDPLADDIRNETRRFALENDIPFINLRNHTGVLRNLIIRNTTTGEWMAIVVGRAENAEEQAQLMRVVNHLADNFPQLNSLLYVVNNKVNDTITDLEVHAYRGADHIYERMGDLRFKIGPKSFYQTNSRQAERLYGVVKSLAELTGEELVYDLYTGTGTIANYLARSARQVIGIEYVPEAIDDARANSKLNGIDNTLFFSGDMKDLLTDEFVQSHGKPDAVITDPPRAGMHPDVVEVIMRTAPSRIVYVSCNPATQARDLQKLEADYSVAVVQPVDMFPHTQHVENVVLLLRK